jgi:hypothetical protein
MSDDPAKHAWVNRVLYGVPDPGAGVWCAEGNMT